MRRRAFTQSPIVRRFGLSFVSSPPIGHTLLSTRVSPAGTLIASA
jgi:hypothetical protein